MIKFSIGILLVSGLLASCTVQRASSNVQQLQSISATTQYDQIKVQLARSIDDPYSVPSLTTFGPGVVKTGAQTTAQYTKKLTEAATAEGITNTAERSFGLPTLNASSDTTLNTTTVSSPVGIRVMRDMYAYAVIGEELDPAIQSRLINKPPTYPWLFHTSSGTPVECQQADCHYLGKYGKYRLWAKDRRSYSDFVLSLLEGGAMKGMEVVLSAESSPARTQARVKPKISILPTTRTNELNKQPNVLLLEE